MRSLVCLYCLHLLSICTTSASPLLLAIPEEIENLQEGNTERVEIKFANCTSVTELRNLSISISDGTDRTLTYPREVYNVPCQVFDSYGNASKGVFLEIQAKVIGFAELAIVDQKNRTTLQKYSVSIIRSPSPLDTIFLVGIIIMVIFNTLCFGISLDLEKVKKFIKKPVAPSIGMACQFTLMPLIAFTLTQVIDKNSALKLGIFSAGVAPGGGASNVWVYALGGDIDLSIAMTLLSSVAALAVIPLWMYTLGQYIIGDESIELPFVNMATTLAYIIIPLGIGLLINRFAERVGKIILKPQKIVIGLTILFAVVVGTWANIYAFKVVLFDYQLALCGILLPWTGGLLSFLIALLLKRKLPIALTIGIETAVQNTSIATILLRTSLEQPWADLSSALPICLNLFTPIPFYFILAGRLIYLRRCKKESKSYEDQIDDGSSNQSFNEADGQNEKIKSDAIKTQLKAVNGETNPVPSSDHNTSAKFHNTISFSNQYL